MRKKIDLELKVIKPAQEMISVALEVDSEWAGEKHKSDDTSNGDIMKTCRCLRLAIYFHQLMSLLLFLTAAKLAIQRPPYLTWDA
ncbi:hypothetical protein [Brevibacillus laterosporus]|uniref:hypothetical protein n=1 Tax=Brevibacillus laterosporus TaxID=1465 RepID=UPI000CE344C1|nr:hypothetical protein [Brevibacillus laterosporus]MBG9771891.1 hypothetical protein [Brevibacillus laterosporus]PPA81754.1 hypothetical protein C4A75_21000 [Brevibacillus laterosporus]